MQSLRTGRMPVSEINRVNLAVHSETGRIARVGLGGALLGMGLGRGGVLGGIVCLAGLEPLLAGIFNFSLVGVVRDMFVEDEDYSGSMHQENIAPVGSTSSTPY